MSGEEQEGVDPRTYWGQIYWLDCCVYMLENNSGMTGKEL